MQITVREATDKDIQAILDLTVEIHIFHLESEPTVFCEMSDIGPQAAHLSELISNDDAAVSIAEANQSVIGYLCARIWQKPDYPGLVPRSFVSVDMVGVMKAMRGRGIGHTLMNWVEEWAIRKGIQEVQLNVWEFNERAIHFYDSIGYETASRRMRKSLSKPGGTV